MVHWAEDRAKFPFAGPRLRSMGSLKELSQRRQQPPSVFDERRGVRPARAHRSIPGSTRYSLKRSPGSEQKKIRVPTSQLDPLWPADPSFLQHPAFWLTASERWRCWAVPCDDRWKNSQ